MANVEFGNTSADMRLVNDFYGIPAFENYVTYTDNFYPVRTEVVSLTPRLVVREFNAAGESVVVSASGTPPGGPFSEITVDAIGIRGTVNGTIFIAMDGSTSGTVTGESLTNIADGSLIARVSGINVSLDLGFHLDSTLLAGGDAVRSGSGDDYLLGYAGNDSISSDGGNDYVEGGSGNDLLTGGPGLDTAVFNAPKSEYTILAAPDARIAVAYDPRGGDELDVLSGFEQGSFAGALGALHPNASVFEYVASYGDLMNAFGANAQAGFDHYVASGYAEGRSISFDGLEYIASYGDLANAFGVNADAGATHYIQSGRYEGRSVSFDSLEYIASYGDLINAFGANADAGAGHYVQSGRFEGRQISFDGLEYIASYTDLINAFGANADAGSTHYIGPGHTEGRHVTFDGLEYIASYGDLINAFHNQVAVSLTPEDIGSNHYIAAGFAEHRAPDLFDAAQYLANYADLQAAFGTDTEAATLHYITAGYFEGRTDDHLL